MDVLATGNNFACVIVFFSSTVCISVFERSPVVRNLIFPSVCARRAYPRWFMGRVGRTPLSPSLTWQRFRTPSQKGVKNICLAPTRTSEGCHIVMLFIHHAFTSLSLSHTHAHFGNIRCNTQHAGLAPSKTLQSSLSIEVHIDCPNI